MGTNDDPFDDLDNLRLTPEAAAAMNRAAASKLAKPRTERPRHGDFVKFPLAWVERLEGTEGSAIFFVAIHILHQDWRTSGKPVPVSNKALKGAGVSRWAKWRALRELEARGLIRVKGRGRRSPLVTRQV
jgi:hypothetical protein